MDLTGASDTRGLLSSRALRWARFVMGGGLNTAVTYVVYIALAQFLNYQLAFLIAYAAGVAFSYFFNSRIVFRMAMTWRGFMAYPLVYLVQYGVSAAALALMVEKLELSKALAPIVVSIVTLPLTYLLSKTIIGHTQASRVRRPVERELAGADTNLGIAALLLPGITLALLVWLPFGPALIGLIEEWDLLGLFNMQSTFFYVHQSGPIALHALRPMMPFSFALAYALDPNSFFFWHVLLLVSLVLKTAASTYLLWKATKSRFLAVAFGALVLVYPADTMQLSFRSLHINWSIALALLACAILFAALESTRRRARVMASTLAALVFLAACCMYEAALTLWIAPLLMLCVQQGPTRCIAAIRRCWCLLGLWALGAGAYVGYALWVSRKIASYQSGLAGGSKGVLAALLESSPKLFTVGALRSLLGGWVDAYRILTAEYSSYAYLIAAALLIGVLYWLLVGRADGQQRATPTSSSPGVLPLRLAVAGTLLMLAGYAPFLLSPAHLAISQRTFIWATPGAALVWVGCLAWLAVASSRVAALAAVVLTALGLSAQLFQFHHYTGIANTQRAMLRAIVENFDGELSNKTLILMDGTGTAGHTWMFLGDELVYALSYLYGHRIGAVEICHQPSMEWQRADSLGRKGTCIKDEQGWTFAPAPPLAAEGAVPSSTSRTLESRNAVVVSIASDGTVVPDVRLEAHRERLRDGQNALALRYRGVLAPASWPLRIPMFKDEFVTDHFKWQFGDYWSLELPIPGSGWREAEWQVGSFRHNAAAWKTREVSDLAFQFAPEDHTYVLHARFNDFSSSVSRGRLQLRLNGTFLPYRWASNNDLLAEIPRATLISGRNLIAFETPVDIRHFGLSAQLDLVEIARLK